MNSLKRSASVVGTQTKGTQEMKTWTWWSVVAVMLVVGAGTAAGQTQPPRLLAGRGSTGVTGEVGAVAVARRTLLAPPLTVQILAGPSTRPGQASLFDDFGMQHWNLPSFEFSLGGQTQTIDPDITFGRVGLAVGLTKAFEVGVALPAFVLATGEEGEGSTSSGPPSLWVGAQLYADVLDFGVRLGVTPAFSEEENVGLVTALPFALHLGESAMIDGAIELQTAFAQEVANTLNIPLRVLVSGTEQVYFGGRANLVYPNFDGDALTIPLGFFAGYTLQHKGRPVADITASLTWPAFGSALNGFDAPITEVFVLGLGVTGHLDVGKWINPSKKP